MDSKTNEEILSDAPDSGAIDASDTVYYSPDPDSQVVAVEPPIISIARAKRKHELRKMRSETSNG